MYQPKLEASSPSTTYRPAVTLPKHLRHRAVPLQRSNVLRVHFAINAPDREHLEGKAVSTHRHVVRKTHQVEYSASEGK